MDGIVAAAVAEVAVPVVEIEVEPWSSFWPDAKLLMLAHRSELGQDDPRAALRPDHFRIDALEAVGGIMILGARDRGSLVGYSI